MDISDKDDDASESKENNKKNPSVVKSTEEQVSDSANIILNTFPIESIYDTYKLRKQFPTLYNDSMNSVLCQELDRFNGLLQMIRSSLHSVQNAAAGIEVMSDELELVFKSIFNGQVPVMWKSKSYPTLKSLIDYVRVLAFFFFLPFSSFFFLFLPFLFSHFHVNVNILKLSFAKNKGKRFRIKIKLFQ